MALGVRRGVRAALVFVLVALAAEPADAGPKAAYLVSFGGYATTEQAVVRGRVARGRPVADKPWRGKLRKAWATARAFLGRDVEHARLRIVSGERAAELRADGEGFFEARLPGPFAAGRRRFEVVLEQPGYRADALSLELEVVDAASGFVAVTDIDDTIIATGVTGSKIDLVTRIAASDARDIVALEGAAEALAAFAAEGVPIVYLSASPVELAPRLTAFLALRRFPAGALFLRHYEDDGIGDPAAYKRRGFETVLRDFPRRKLVLFGDNGERDPEIFARLAGDTGRVEVGFVRRTVPAADGEPRYQGMQLFGSWGEVVALATARGILR